MSTEINEINTDSNAVSDSLNDTLAKLLDREQKQLFYSRLAGISLVVMAAILLVVCIIIVPRAMATLSNVDKLVNDTTATVEELQTTVEQAGTMIDEITVAAGGINKLVDDNSEILNESVSKMNSIDFETLNKAISDLSDVVQPMANFMNKFR